MRILYISYYYFPRVSAATWSTYAISQRLAKNHDVLLLVPNIKYEMALNNEEIRETEKKNPVFLIRTPGVKIPLKLAPLISPLILFLRGLILGKNNDIIICQFHPHHFTFIVAFFLGKIFRIPVVARANDIHRDMCLENQPFLQKVNIFRRTIFNTLNESFVKYANSFLVVCRENKEILESRLGRLKNLRISYNGVDPNEFKGISKKDARKYLNIELKDKVILFTGRFSGPEYRIDALLKSFTIIQKNIHNSLLILVGDKLQKAIQKELIFNSKRVRIIGPVTRSEIKRYLAASDVCVGPLGRTRAIPLKVLEYMVCGKPIITGINSVSRDVAIDGFNCICTPPEPQAVAEAIIKVLENEAYAQFLGTNAVKKASNFTWDKIVQDLEEVLLEAVNYQQLINKHN